MENSDLFRVIAESLALGSEAKVIAPKVAKK
jgi:hypothetical protein